MTTRKELPWNLVTKNLILLSVAAIITGSAIADTVPNYNDFIAKGYRWVAKDGPYGCPSKDELREIAKDDSESTELQTIREGRAYYLIRGDIVKVIQQDAASGMSLIRVPGISRDLWTFSRFLSKRPVENAFGTVETPERWSLILSGDDENTRNR